MSVNGWFTLTGGGTSHGGACTANSNGCICSDVHKCTPDVKIAGVNLFKQGWLPTKPGSCRPDLTVYGKNYFDSACCPPGTYGGPARTGPFSISCTPGVAGTGAGYGGGGSGTAASVSSGAAVQTSAISPPLPAQDTTTTPSILSSGLILPIAGLAVLVILMTMMG